MADLHENETPVPEDDVDAQRREFLRTSIYAAYATPLIASLLVAEKSVAQSTGCPPRLQRLCDRFPNLPVCDRFNC
jgi:hypothetical protein